MCVCVRLLEWLHWWHTFLCNLLEKRYVIFIISWHCSLGNFLADTLRYLSWPALSRSWHLAASGMGLGVMSHQAGLLTTLHHIHICFPEQGGNMVTTMGWGFSDFRHLFCFTLLINKACMYHNHIPLMYIFNSPANECWVSFSFKDNSRVTSRVTGRSEQHRKNIHQSQSCLTWIGGNSLLRIQDRGQLLCGRERRQLPGEQDRKMTLCEENIRFPVTKTQDQCRREPPTHPYILTPTGEKTHARPGQKTTFSWRGQMATPACPEQRATSAWPGWMATPP